MQYVEGKIDSHVSLPALQIEILKDVIWPDMRLDKDDSKLYYSTLYAWVDVLFISNVLIAIRTMG